jgi:hypothetical protein
VTAVQKNSETKKPTWHFVLSFEDGRTEEITVEARDFPSAIFTLPRFADVGKFKYKLLNSR